MVLRGLVFILLLCMPYAAFAQTSVAVRIVDGDTLKLGDTTVRLHGVDAPEFGQKCAKRNGGTWACGKDATALLQTLTTGQDVSCDDRGTDDYGRVIGVCMAGGIDLNAELVAKGAAWAFRRFSDDYAPIEDAAKADKVGIWQANTQTPWDYRSERWNVAAQEAPDGCPIKGNISGSGMIYHAPWSPWYSRTKVSVEKGERWFCDEAEAIAAGWRAPLWGY